MTVSPKEIECPDHWHCDPSKAAHVCDNPIREKRCPSCGERPRPITPAEMLAELTDVLEKDAVFVSTEVLEAMREYITKADQEYTALKGVYQAAADSNRELARLRHKCVTKVCESASEQFASFEQSRAANERLRAECDAVREERDAARQQMTEFGQALGYYETPNDHVHAMRRMVAEIARLRSVTGPDCPRCGHFLRSDHRHIVHTSGGAFVRAGRDIFTSADDAACITESELVSDHPEIARSMGLIG